MNRTFLLSLRATGLDVHQDRVVEMCVAPLVTNRNVPAFHTYVNPGEIVRAETLAVYGITAHQLSRAPMFAFAMERMLVWLGVGPERTTILVAHNGNKYQWPLMTQELRRARLPMPGNVWLWDTIHLCRRLYPKQLPSMRLYDINASFFPNKTNPGTAREDIEILRCILPCVARCVARSSKPLPPERVYAQLEESNEEVVANANKEDSRPFCGSQLCVNTLTGKEWPVGGTPGGTVGAATSLRGYLKELSAAVGDGAVDAKAVTELDALLQRREAREEAREAVSVAMNGDEGFESVETACDLLCEAALHIHRAKEKNCEGIDEPRRLSALLAALCVRGREK